MAKQGHKLIFTGETHERRNLVVYNGEGFNLTNCHYRILFRLAIEKKYNVTSPAVKRDDLYGADTSRNMYRLRQAMDLSPGELVLNVSYSGHYILDLKPDEIWLEVKKLVLILDADLKNRLFELMTLRSS